jgi:hypothetical protein
MLSVSSYLLFSSFAPSFTCSYTHAIASYSFNSRELSGPYLFTRLLTPALVAGSSSSPNPEKSRVVHLCSEAANLPGAKLDYDALTVQSREEKEIGRIQAMRLYASSKLVSLSSQFSSVRQLH